MRETIVVVEAEGRAGAWACRSLVRAGFRVVGTAGSASAARAARIWCDAVALVPSPQADGAGFVDGLVETIELEGAGAVMQTDNEAATELLTAFTGRTPAVVVGPDAAQFAALCDKSILPQTLLAAGLDTPYTVVAGPGRTDDLPPPPCVIKPASAGTGSGQRHVSQAAVVAHDEKERDELVRDLVAATGSAIVQERIVGTPWRIHFVAGRSAFVALPVQTRLSNPRDAGVSTVQHVPAEAPAAIFLSAERLIRSVGYVGPGSVQFIERGGIFHVHDINLRLPASVGISIKAGLDMPALAAECALGRDQVLEDVLITRGVTYVWLGGELRALVSGLREPRRAISAIALFASVVGRAAVSPAQVIDHPPVRARLASAVSAVNAPSRKRHQEGHRR
jgi:carbamoyl-phosphate synthase large subunit